MLFILVADVPASEGEDIARTRPAGANLVCPVRVGKACKLETVVRASPQRQAHVNGPMEVSEYRLHGMHVRVRGGCLGGANDAQRRSNIGTRANGRVLKTAREAGVDVFRHPGKGGEAMCARPERKPGSIGWDEGLQSVMPYLARMVRRYLDWSSEMVRAQRLRMVCMPRSWEGSRSFLILNRAPS
jgi:hypothetical protein